MANAKFAIVHFQRRLYFLTYVFLLKIAFWTLGFVLSHPNIHRTIMEGISSVFGTAGTKIEFNYIIEETSNNMSHTSRAKGSAHHFVEI